MKYNFIIMMALIVVSCATDSENQTKELPVNEEVELPLIVEEEVKQKSVAVQSVSLLAEELEKKIFSFGSTTLEELSKSYKIGKGDDYGNHFIEELHQDLGYKQVANFVVEEGKLAYITYKEVVLDETVYKADNEEILKSLIDKYGEPSRSEEAPERREWSLEDYNVVFYNRANWELNFEPKDYHPGF